MFYSLKPLTEFKVESLLWTQDLPLNVVFEGTLGSARNTPEELPEQMWGLWSPNSNWSLKDGSSWKKTKKEV